MKVGHHILSMASYSSYQKFLAATKKPQKLQKNILNKIIDSDALMSVKRFESLELSYYQNYKADIELARQAKRGPFAKCSRFEPTSGSTETIKWIPYNDTFKAELDRAAGPWLRDLYLRYPAIKEGPHYWSLSWLPDDLRKEMNAQDTNALPWYKAFLLNHLMVTDSSFEKLPTSKLFMMTSLLKIIEKEASLISVWSPTFLLRLLDLLLEEKDWLLESFKGSPKVKNAIQGLTSLEADSLKEVFPKLVFISSWDSASSTVWAQKLKSYFPDTPFQGKGLWATEGVVTIPFHGHYPLAVCSHYYEFWHEADQRLLGLDQLSKGMVVQPVITSGNGFYRYHLKDNIKVVDFFEQTPCFEFLGRSRHLDMAGEKISFDEAAVILQRLANEYKGLEFICLMGCESPESRGYQVLLQEEPSLSGSQTLSLIEEALETQLLENHHYKLARELGQLEKATLLVDKDALGLYYKACGQKICGEGNIKPEPLIHYKDFK